jgi:hypothetical protein
MGGLGVYGRRERCHRRGEIRALILLWLLGMHQRLFGLVVFFAIVPLQLGFGRLGDTSDECAAHYGSRTGNSGSDQATFNRDHLVITVRLRGDRSIQEDFAPESGDSISETQVAQILGENSEGSTWEIMGETPVATSYFRKDGRAQATVAKEGAQLTVGHARVIVKYTASGIPRGT